MVIRADYFSGRAISGLNPEIKKPLIGKQSRVNYLRSEAESNRCRRFCRPLPDRSATRPFVGGANIQIFTIISSRGPQMSLTYFANLIANFIYFFKRDSVKGTTCLNPGKWFG